MNAILMVGIVILVAVLLLWYLSPKCNHKWKVLDKYVVPSCVEVAHDHNLTITRGGNSSLLVEVHHVAYSCTECGKLKQTTIKTGGRI